MNLPRPTSGQNLVDGPLGVRRIKREGGNLDVKVLARLSHHTVSPNHEARRRRQRHTARVLERLSRLEHGFLANHAGTLDFLQPSMRIRNTPMPGFELNRFRAKICDVDSVGPEEISVAR